MQINERQVALSVLECLREDLTYARLNNGCRILDVADLRQYIYEEMARIRTHALTLGELYGRSYGHAIPKGNGHDTSRQFTELP